MFEARLVESIMKYKINYSIHKHSISETIETDAKT